MAQHAISVDFEDWYQSTVDETSTLTDRFQASTEKVLEAFADAGVHATFFVLGLAAETAPQLVKRIADAGQLRDDLLRAKALIEDLTGQEVYGYRSPCFSVDERNLWALDVLAETHHRYDSSIFPVKKSRYGIDGYAPEPRIVETPRGHRLIADHLIGCLMAMGEREA